MIWECHQRHPKQNRTRRPLPALQPKRRTRGQIAIEAGLEPLAACCGAIRHTRQKSPLRNILMR